MVEMASEYLRSAEKLKERINELKINEPSEVERIMLLHAEYKYLIKQAHYLEHYYDKESKNSVIA